MKYGEGEIWETERPNKDSYREGRKRLKEERRKKCTSGCGL